MRDPVRLGALILTLTVVVGISRPVRLAGAELSAMTARAYSEYLESAEAAFVARASADRPASPLKDGDVIARPARGSGIVDVTGGLVHHWAATAFLRGVHIQRAIDVSQAYARYPSIYQSVTEATLLKREGDTFQVLMRLKEHQSGITVVLQVRTTVVYTHVSDTQTYVVSNADDIREVENAGGEHERLLPAGRDRGYLWRANVLTSFVEQRDGVLVEMETLGLSRRFPYMLGWILEPIALRVGRKSVEASLKEFLSAVREATGPAGPGR
jgi:hypothetical protein